ncbi:MAG TPA: APC family permease [Gammaproteobacteria bacterium]|nr:APC family permease [Gammaproteobacteria bacterium]
MAENQGEQRIFLRKASGLIRTASGADTFIYNFGLVSVGLGIASIMYYGPAYYPGGNLLWASVLAGVVMACIAFGLITWTVTLPRSGGIYVFGSRSLPPFLALTLSLVEIFTWLFYCAIAAFWIQYLGLSPAFYLIGVLTDSDGWINASGWILEPWPMFLIGSAILILSGVVLGAGMRFYLNTQKFVISAALIGSAILIFVLLPYSNADFIASFNAIIGPTLGEGGSYEAVIASGREQGWGAGWDGTTDWRQTWLVANWPFLPLIGSAFSIAIGGEVKSAEKSHTWGMLGAIAVTVVIWLITIWLCIDRFGYEFLGTAAFNYTEGVGIQTDPTITLLAGVLTGSPLVSALVAAGFIFWMWMWIPGMHTFGVRAVVAWAFDRVAPAPLGEISEKRHTPVVAIWFCVVITVIFMALFVFTEFFSTIVILIEAAVLAWSIVLAAGIFFPYTRPEIYEKSPIANKKILGLPMMTVACALGTAGAQFFFWTLWADPVAAGHDPLQLLLVFGVFVIGVVFYFVMKAIRKSQGIDVTLAFKEIPIE